MFRPSLPKNGTLSQSRPRLDMFRPTRPKLSMFRLCSTEQEHCDQVRQGKSISTKFDRGKTFRPSSTEHFFRPRKNVARCSIEEKRLDRGIVSTEKNFDRNKKTFRLCLTEEKSFDRVRPMKFFDRKKVITRIWV